MDFLNQIQSLLQFTLIDISLARLLIALLIFFAVYLFRNMFLHICIKFVKKGTSRTKTTIDDQMIDAIEPPVRFLLIIIGLWAAILYMNMPEKAAALAIKGVRSLFVFTFFWAVYRAMNIFTDVLRKATMRTKTDVDDQLVLFISKFMRFAVAVLGGMVIIREWGFDIAGLIAGLGLGGLAIALAAKDTVSNIFGSITILLDKPFKVGDWVETPEIEGIIEDINLRCTQVRTFANALVSVPNSILANNPITNWSRMKKRRIKYSLGVTYDTSSRQMEKCLNDLKTMLEQHPDIHQGTIFVYFNDFGDNALEIFMYFFTKTTVWQEYLHVRQDINLKIMKIIEDNGMSVAFPSRSIYIEKHQGDSHDGRPDPDS